MKRGDIARIELRDETGRSCFDGNPNEKFGRVPPIDDCLVTDVRDAGQWGRLVYLITPHGCEEIHVWERWVTLTSVAEYKDVAAVAP